MDFIPKEILERGWICLENPLIELTENAHMTLFGVMMLFLLIVVSNIYIGRRQLKFWPTVLLVGSHTFVCHVHPI